LDIMSSLAPEDTLNYQIPNFSCNDDLCENIIIMPNPNNGIFDVQILQVPQDAQIGLYLYDIAGKLLLKVDNNRKENNLIFNSDGDLLTVDKNTFSFNLNNFPNGMYLLKIKTDTANGSKQTAVKKIMKMRNNNF